MTAIEQEAERYLIDNFGSATGNKPIFDAIIFGANSKHVQAKVIQAKIDTAKAVLNLCHLLPDDRDNLLINIVALDKELERLKA